MLDFKNLDYSVIEIENIGELSKTTVYHKYEDWNKNNVNKESVKVENSDSFLWVKITGENIERLIVGDSILFDDVECKLKACDILGKHIQLEGAYCGWFSINIYDCYFKLLVGGGYKCETL